MDKQTKENLYKQISMKHHNSSQHMNSEEIEAFKDRLLLKKEN